jgi:GTP cyclohydrolase I
MTHQAADAMVDLLGAHGVAVYLEADHLCTQMRGVREHDAMTRTTAFRGVYERDAALRSEFYDISGLRRGSR